MKLKSLRLHGFKSFADSVEIEFHSGITAVVGPNGCGKSNISDAIRWVLGEQRPSVIRGAKMEEAIFQGSVNRRPVNRGSVAMVISNEDGALPVPFEEVEIGRVVYRDGGSEYRINRSSCRLKDVVDLCRDTGLGADAYAVIEHRMIDAILSDRADERRSLFEEASGIGKYKDRRKTALRRLEQAESDLQRLEDVIGEVENKVRSLARQKGKAERYRELRERHLAVEVAVVRHELTETGERLSAVEKGLDQDRTVGEGKVAVLRSAETEYESLRLRETEVERERTGAARALDELRQGIVRWERDLAVAEEQRRSAGARLERIDGERDELGTENEAIQGSVGVLDARLGDMEATLTAAQTTRDEATDRAGEIQSQLSEGRVKLDALQTRERDLTRRGVLLGADTEASRAQAAELDRHLSQLSSELEHAATTLSDIDSQGDLFTDQLVRVEAEVVEVREAAETAKRDLDRARIELHEAVQADISAVERATSVRARREALERIDEEGAGSDPAMTAVVSATIEGVIGPLRDFIRPGDAAGPVERCLGPMAGALVVSDRDTVRRIGAWFEDEWGAAGGLVLLPLDQIPSASSGGSLLAAAGAFGAGEPWVKVFLGGIDLVSGQQVFDGTGARVGADGHQVDARGVVWLGNPTGAPMVLARREELASLRVEQDAVDKVASAARGARTVSEEGLTQAEDALGAARELLHAQEETLRRGRAEVDDHVDARARTDRHRDELIRQVGGTRAARDRLLARAAEAESDSGELETLIHAATNEATESRSAVEAVVGEWEMAQREASQRSAQLAVLQGEEGLLNERKGELAVRAQTLAARLESLNREEVERRSELERAESLRGQGGSELERLFQERDAALADLVSREEAHQQVRKELEAMESGLRRARAEERTSADRRHTLELERQELVSTLDRIRDRLEAEWGRSLERLLAEAEPVEGEPDALREELGQIVLGIERIGPVNMLAMEEHQEESERLEFLREQHDDLTTARDDLRAAIQEINRTATELFTKTFELIRARFRETYLRLFEGGDADLWLTDPDDPLESQIEIHASPRGKKTQRIELLSGGERALTALALLFGIYLVKPSPFCVLDEVDAPLDEANIGRFVRLLQEFKHQTQFVVITHNPRTIEAADWIYGVTMEEPGVSKIVGVRLEDALLTTEDAA